MIEQIKTELHKIVANNLIQHIVSVWDMYESDFSKDVNIKNQVIDFLTGHLQSKKSVPEVSQPQPEASSEQPNQ